MLLPLDSAGIPCRTLCACGPFPTCPSFILSRALERSFSGCLWLHEFGDFGFGLWLLPLPSRFLRCAVCRKAASQIPAMCRRSFAIAALSPLAPLYLLRALERSFYGCLCLHKSGDFGFGLWLFRLYLLRALDRSFMSVSAC